MEIILKTSDGGIIETTSEKIDIVLNELKQQKIRVIDIKFEK